jgi:hypothetical protein
MPGVKREPLDYSTPASGGERYPTWVRITLATATALFAAVALISGGIAAILMTGEWPIPQFYLPFLIVAVAFGILAILAAVTRPRTKTRR